MKKILITRKLIKESEDKASKTFEAIFNSNDELYSQSKIIDMSKNLWIIGPGPSLLKYKKLSLFLIYISSAYFLISLFLLNIIKSEKLFFINLLFYI